MLLPNEVTYRYKTVHAIERIHAAVRYQGRSKHSTCQSGPAVATMGHTTPGRPSEAFLARVTVSMKATRQAHETIVVQRHDYTRSLGARLANHRWRDERKEVVAVNDLCAPGSDQLLDARHGFD
jgi:hypothetical protein